MILEFIFSADRSLILLEGIYSLASFIAVLIILYWKKVLKGKSSIAVLYLYFFLCQTLWTILSYNEFEIVPLLIFYNVHILAVSFVFFKIFGNYFDFSRPYLTGAVLGIGLRGSDFILPVLEIYFMGILDSFLVYSLVTATAVLYISAVVLSFGSPYEARPNPVLAEAREEEAKEELPEAEEEVVVEPPELKKEQEPKEPAGPIWEDEADKLLGEL